MGHKSSNVTPPKFTENLELLGKGIECVVYEVVKYKLVCKIYISDAEAEYCYRLQRIAYRAGIAPEPLALEENYYFSRYIESYDRMDSVPKLPLWDIPGIHKTGFGKIRDSADYQEFINKIHDVFGGAWTDEHGGNIGIVFVNGICEYRIIDFGIAGFDGTALGKLLSEKLSVYY